MKMLIHAIFPNEPFNEYVREGTVGEKIKKILGFIKPAAAYFTEYGGRRSAMLIVDVRESSEVPVIAEPFFLVFDAEVHFHAVMTPEDLEKASLDKLGQEWA